ncbi:FAD linked oxidase [Macrophomina phaseolina MS6]|uniref:FAD linked oxidase n=1 Tax=Macrophomina phaseolina (strain MS6) TaxID=1126212 RepID=K2RTC1_MACPH|nr:FAD linked oxidase [Macrophomina phaseolina MS6]
MRTHLAITLLAGTCSVRGAWGETLSDWTRSTSRNANCCSILGDELPGKIVISGAKDFNASVDPYWSAQAEAVKPACVVLPESAEDVSKAIKILSAAARLGSEACKFAIRSGGHTPNADAANIQGGVTINLAGLNTVTPAEDRSYVSVGPGNRWEDVYRVLDPQNLTVVGGRSRTVGVGGLVLMGGMSFFSPRVGLPCANVLNFEVVLASGEIVNANIQENPDLYKALKGGINNFGVVTRLDLKALEQGAFWGGVANWAPEDLPALFDHFEAFASSDGYDEFAQLTLLYGWVYGGEVVMGHIHYTKPEPFPATFENFTEVVKPASETFRIEHLTNFTVELESTGDGKSQRLFTTATFKNSAVMNRRFYELATTTARDLNGTDGLLFIVSAQPFNQVTISKANETGGTFQGLDEEDGDLMIYCLTIQWDNEADNAKVSGIVEDLMDKAEAVAKEIGVFNEYIFPNYAAVWQDPIAGYGEANVAELRAISGKYDPSQLFQMAVPGGFKL